MQSQGRYRIHAVAELTGVPEATLRAWERRYSVPTPLRTASGYRLYSHKDVEVVRRMRELCAGGMAPADAAKLAGVPATTVAEQHRDPYQATAERIVEATQRMDPGAIENEVRLAMTLGDAQTVVERIFCPAMREIGDAWERGSISVAHEHLVSEIVATATRDMLRLLGPTRPLGEVLLACFADEEHSLPLYAATFRFLEWGYRPRVLGARTPPSAVGVAIQELSPAFVGLSVTMVPPPGRAEELVIAYAGAIGRRAWAVGGRAARALAPLIEVHGGHVLEGPSVDTHEALGKLLVGGRR